MSSRGRKRGITKDNWLKRQGCSFDGCTAKVHAKRLCAKHYQNGSCIFPGCQSGSRRRGMCDKHYFRLRRSAEPKTQEVQSWGQGDESSASSWSECEDLMFEKDRGDFTSQSEYSEYSSWEEEWEIPDPLSPMMQTYHGTTSLTATPLISSHGEPD